jgi:phosphomevalonate kinase
MKTPAVHAALLSVPGTILLLGEYAVLEEGGLGVAAAVERRVAISIEPAEELSILGVGGGFSGLWRAAEGEAPSLVGSVVEAVERELEARGLGERAPALAIRIDSSAFYGPEGDKLGLGSSGAVAVGAASALLRYSGLAEGELADATFGAALEAHRSHQGGIGSGYDIAASLHGGWGLFTGGALPSFEQLELPWMPPLSLHRGAGPVDTKRAIERYLEWKGRNPRVARDFLEASNGVIRSLGKARTWAEASLLLEEGSRLGLELGAAIGVPAGIAMLEGRGGKALGAGNELAALWDEDSEESPGGLGPLIVAAKGPLWRK